MKKQINTLLMLLLFAFATGNIMAQTPEMIKYQAVLRDASGNIVPNTAKTVVVDILQGSSSGTSVYQETHSVTTTAQGVINLNIGGGTVNSGSFSGINWSTNSYWTKVTVDAVEITNGQLLSTPYALSVKGLIYDPATGNARVNGLIHSNVDYSACFQVGNDATLNDFNMGNGIGIFGTFDPTLGHLKLGNTGPILSGKTGYLGIGTTNPGSLLTLEGTDANTLINVMSSHASYGPALFLNSTATGGRDWRITSCQTGNAGGQGSLEVWDATAGAGRMAIKPNGWVGIGTMNPGNFLDVNGVGVFRGNVYINTGSNDAILHLGPSSKRSLGYAQNWDQNNLYINGWSDWNGTYVNGTEFYLDCRTWIYNQEDLVFKGYGANADYWFDNYDDGGAADFRAYSGSTLKAYLNNGVNGWQTPSDERLKGNIETLSVLDKMDMVRGASYTLNYSGATQIGVIAQEMKAAFPAVVTGDESTGMLGVDYNAVAAIALQGVKELNAKVLQLEKEIAELKAMINNAK
jgi:hypothetical protein